MHRLFVCRSTWPSAGTLWAARVASHLSHRVACCSSTQSCSILRGLPQTTSGATVAHCAECRRLPLVLRFRTLGCTRRSAARASSRSCSPTLACVSRVRLPQQPPRSPTQPPIGDCSYRCAHLSHGQKSPRRPVNQYFSWLALLLLTVS